MSDIIRTKEELAAEMEKHPNGKIVQLENAKVKAVAFKIMDFIREERFDELEALMAMTLICEGMKEHYNGVIATIPDKEKML